MTPMRLNAVYADSAPQRGAFVRRPRPMIQLSQLQAGLYVVKQRSLAKRVDHYGILDVGNRLKFEWSYSARPVIVHQTPPTLRVDWAENTGHWQVVGRIVDEESARTRVRAAAASPGYNLLGNNCEHFARFTATGVPESRQLQGYCAIVALVAAVVVANTRVA